MDTSLYAMQIERYLEHFARDQLLVITSEDLWEDRRRGVRRVFEFIGVDANWVPSNLGTVYHETAERRAPRPRHQAVRRRRGGYRKVMDRVPLSVRRGLWKGIGPLVGWRVDPAIGRIPDQLRARLEDLVRDDVRRLRIYMEDGFDGWAIA